MKDAIFIVVFGVAFVAAIGLVSFLFTRVVFRTPPRTIRPVPLVPMTPDPPPCKCPKAKDIDVVAQELFWALDTAIHIWENDEVVWGEIEDAPTDESIRMSRAIYELEVKIHEVWIKYHTMYQGDEKWRRK